MPSPDIPRRSAPSGPVRGPRRPLLAASLLLLTTALVLAAVAGVTVLVVPGARHRLSTPVAAPLPVARSAPAPDDAAPAVLAAPCRPAMRVCVQLSTQHIWLLEGARVVRDGFVSTGASDTATPTGAFRVRSKDATYRSRAYGTAMPYSVFFDTNGDALHEGSVGRESRGCVHLEHDDAVAFFDALRPGDALQILP